MITEEEQKRVIDVLGKHYSGKIIAHLNKKEIVNTDGNAFSPESIRLFVGGHRENETVEFAILQFVNTTEKANQRKAERRQKLTSKN